MDIELKKDAQFYATVEQTVRELVTLKTVGDSCYVNLPLLYPDSSQVTVRLDRVARGIRVSDSGFCYREVESIGAGRSFLPAAKSLIGENDITIQDGCIYSDTDYDGLFRTICDVSEVSWATAKTIFAKSANSGEMRLQVLLRKRLADVFGAERVAEGRMTGASATDWDVSAMVTLGKTEVIFHAVEDQPNSIFKASAAFHDIAALPRHPVLVAVVHDRAALGTRLGLLSQTGRVIEQSDPDSVFHSVAA